MDNLTHTLTGALLAQTRLRERTPYATTALVIGANLPDIDIVSRLVGGKTAYLQFHRGVTHAIAGVLVLSLALTLAICVVNRLRSAEKRRKIPLSVLLQTTLLGAFSHPLLDFTNAYGIRPFLPLSSRWVHGDLVFIVDPLLWLILGGALFLLTSKARRQQIFWAGLAVLLTVAVLSAPPVGIRFKAFWLIAVALLLVARLSLKVIPGGLAVTALAAMVTYWGLRGVAHGIALDRISRYAQDRFGTAPNLRIAALPTPTSPFVWRAVVDTGSEVFTADRLDLLGELENLTFRRRSRDLDDPVVQKALATPTGAVMRAFARFLISRVIDKGDHVEVILTDARWVQGDDMGWCAVTVVLPGSLLSPHPKPEKERQTIKGSAMIPEIQ